MKNNRFIIGFIFGIIVSSGIVYAATYISSTYVTYTSNSQSTVEGALDDLYTKSNYGDAAASDIKSGKTALVNGSYVTGTLTVPSYTSLSGTQNVSAGSSSTTLNGYYNMSNYKVSCGTGSCVVSNLNFTKIASGGPSGTCAITQITDAVSGEV